MDMQAIVLTRPGTPDACEMVRRTVPEPGPGEVLIRLRAAALNHRDLRLVKGTYAQQPRDFILGSDGAGEVSALGAGVTGFSAGQGVLINTGLFCGSCSYCLQGEHSLCDTFGILGGPSDGTFAEYVKVPAHNLLPIPSHLSFPEGAALPLALGTAWRALITRGRLAPGETVLIHGVGGGVAHFALTIASGMGARAIVTSSSPEKLARAQKMGAAAGINYREEDVASRVRELTGSGVDLVLDTMGTPTFPISLASVRKGGRILFFASSGPSEAQLPIRALFANQVSLIGTMLNSTSDLTQALSFVSHRGLRPQLSATFLLSEAVDALGVLDRGEQFGKVVLTIA